MDRHFGPLTGPIDREKSETGDRQPIEMMIGIAELLARELRRRIRRHRPIQRCRFHEWDLGHAPVHGGGGREDERLQLPRPGHLEERHRATDIHVLVQQWISDRRPHAGPRGGMEDLRDRVLREHALQTGRIAEVAFDEREGRMCGGRRQVGALDRGIVKRVEVVQTHDTLATREQRLDHMRADEARAAGDECRGCGAHAWDAFAAYRNPATTSRLPFWPGTGESQIPFPCRPSASRGATTRSTVPRRSASSRTIPPRPTLPFPTSNCGLISVMIVAARSKNGSTAGTTSSSEINETSMTANPIGSGTSARSRYLILRRSSTTTRGSCRRRQSNCP